MTPPCVVLCRVIALRRTDHRYFEAAAFDIVIFAFLVLFPAIREEELPVVRLFVRIAPFNGQLAQFLLRPCRNAFAPQAVAFFFTVKAWVFPVNLALRVAAFVNKFRDVRVAVPAHHTLAFIKAVAAVFTSFFGTIATIALAIVTRVFVAPAVVVVEIVELVSAVAADVFLLFTHLDRCIPYILKKPFQFYRGR